MSDILFKDEPDKFTDDQLFWAEHELQSVAYGEETPDAVEASESWKTGWHDALGLVPPISGDQDWGSLVVEETCFGPVRRLAEGSKTITVIQNKYGSGSGTVVVYIRGSATPFTWDALSPSWSVYSTPVVLVDWLYVQLKADVT